MIILDTNVVSETMKPLPSSRVQRWMAGYPPERLFTTAITPAEILVGIRLLSRGKRRAILEAAAEAMFEDDFRGRILPFDLMAARAFAEIAVGRRAGGRPISQSDAQIAAIAHSHGAAVATRDVKGFDSCGIIVLDPWAIGR